MAVVTIGETSITFDNADEQSILSVDRATRTSAGGRSKSQVSGRKFRMIVEVATTAEKAQEFWALNASTNEAHFYTPEETYTIYDDIEFPIEVVFEDFESFFDNRRTYYLRFSVTGVDYIV